MGTRAITAVLSCFLLLPTGCALQANVRDIQPLPNLLADQRYTAAVVVDVAGVSDDTRCLHYSAAGTGGNLCITGMRTAFSKGLAYVLGANFGYGPGAPQLAAHFRVIDVDFQPVATAASSGTYEVVARWQFELRDPHDNLLMQTTGSSQGILLPGRGRYLNEPDPVFMKQLVESMAEAVGQAINQQGPKLAELLRHAPNDIASRIQFDDALH
jgi:hypothetical protein